MVITTTAVLEFAKRFTELPRWRPRQSRRRGFHTASVQGSDASWRFSRRQSRLEHPVGGLLVATPQKAWQGKGVSSAGGTPTGPLRFPSGFFDSEDVALNVGCRYRVPSTCEPAGAQRLSVPSPPVWGRPCRWMAVRLPRRCRHTPQCGRFGVIPGPVPAAGLQLSGRREEQPAVGRPRGTGGPGEAQRGGQSSIPEPSKLEERTSYSRTVLHLQRVTVESPQGPPHPTFSDVTALLWDVGHNCRAKSDTLW